MAEMNHIEKLEKLDACDPAVKFARGFKSLNAAWQACERGDWLLWYAGKMSGDPGSAARKKLVLCACECARLALPFAGKNEAVAREAIETAESWARGEGATLDDVWDAAGAASRAADAAISASFAAFAAAEAAVAACRAAVAASCASCAADAASRAAFAADVAGAADAATLKKCADIVRKHYPRLPRKRR